MSDALDLKFKSKEELRAICQYLGARMHFLNRTSMGEQVFSSTVAEALIGIGRAFDENYDNKDVRAAFGDGWTNGTIDRSDRITALMDLAFPDKLD